MAGRTRGGVSSRGRAGRILVWLSRLLLALVLVVTAALAAAFWFENAILRPLSEYLVETATGRTFSIAGELDARAGRIVTIRATRISLANADWGSRDNLLSIDEVEASVDLLRLLDGTPALDTLEASGIELLFEEDDEGLPNWMMGAGEDNSSTATESRNAIVLPVIRSRFSNVAITFDSAALESPLELRFDSLGHDATQANELRLEAIGAVENRPLNLQARIGPLQQLLGAGAVDFDISADLDVLAFEASGELDSLRAPRQARVKVAAQTADIARIFTTLGLPEMASGASQLAFNILPFGDHHAIDLTAAVDSLRIEARARLQALDSIDGASIELSAAGPDLGAAARLAGLPGLPGQPFEFESRASLSGQQLTLGKTRFDSGDNHLTAEGTMSRFPDLGGSNLQLRLVGKNYLEFAALLGLGEVAALRPEPFELRSSLDYTAQGRQLFTARLALADLNGEFDGELTDDPAYAGSHLDYRLEGRNDGLLQRILGRPTGVEGSYNLQGKLRRSPLGYDIQQAALTFGANALEINGTLGAEPLRADSRLTAHFRGPDLDKIAAIAGYDGFVPAGIVEIDASAQVRDDAIQVDGLVARLGRNRLQASGLVRLQDAAVGSRVEVALSGEDIVDVLPPDLLAFVDPQQAFELSGALAVGSGSLEVDGLQARLGEVVLEGSGRVSTTQPMTAASLRFNARGPDLAAIVPENLLPYRLPAAEFAVTGGVALAPGGLLLDGIEARIGADRVGVSGTIPLETPTEGLDLAVTASGPNLRNTVPAELNQFDFAEQPFDIAGEIGLAKGILSLRQLEVSAPRGRLSGQVNVAIDNPRRFGEFDLKASGSDLAEFSASMLEYRPANVAFDLDARGSWNSERIKIERGLILLGDANIEVRGEVDLPPGVTATRLVIAARGSNLADLGQYGELALPEDEFDIEARLSGNADQLQIPRLDISIGDSDLRGSLYLTFAEKPKIQIELESEKLELVKLLPPNDGEGENEPPQPLPSDGRLIPRLAVPVDQLQRIDLEARVRMGEMQLRNSILRDIEIDTRLQNGELTVSRLQARAREGRLVAQFRAAAVGERIVTSGTLQGTEIVFGGVQDDKDGSLYPQQNLELEFETEGATVRELAANLDGYLQLTGGGGRMKNSLALDLFGNIYAELLSTINPLVEREPYTTISCFAAYAEITDGVAEIEPGAVLQTDKLNIFARGSIALDTEKIQLRFDTSPRKGLGISLGDFVNPFVGVSGTLASPGLGVDPKNAMFQGGFAYATGGLSIVAKSLFDRWFGAEDPCAYLENEARESRREKHLPKQQGAGERPASTVENR
jgi:uncharacterized protein involved in outer membrane biogenesis